MGNTPDLAGQQTPPAAASKLCRIRIRIRILVLTLLLTVGGLTYAQTADRSMYGVFDRVPSKFLSVAGVRIQYAQTPGTITASAEDLDRWLAQAMTAVTTYFGRFPVSEFKLLIIPSGGKGVRSGNAFGHRGAAVRVFVGTDSTAEDLEADWVLVHELTHLAVPSLDRKHHWFEEGLATYVESIARLQIDDLSPEAVWQGLAEGMPHGQPAAGDRGLDNTPIWGRTYWGGALFCLQADIELRRATDNRMGLQDALRGILDSGGSIEQQWPMERLMAVADQATGTRVMRDLYAAQSGHPVVVDLQRLWDRLGVLANADPPGFDDRAPDADIRLAIGRPEPVGDM